MSKTEDTRIYYDITVTQLRDLEQRVLNYMLLSPSKFDEIVTQLEVGYFVFTVHKRIFKQLFEHKEYFLKGCDFFIDSLSLKIDDFTFIALHFEGLKRSAVKEILSLQASTDIKSDIATMKKLYAQRYEVLQGTSPTITIVVEDKNSYTTTYFVEGIAIEIKTRGLMHISDELLYLYTKKQLDYISSIDLEKEGIEMTMDVIEDADETVEEIVSVHYKKDLTKLQWIENLCKWADQLGLDEKIFPRTRAGLEELRELNLSNKGIDALPEELTKLQNLEFLILCDNNLETIPGWISKLQKLKALHLANNKISTLPKEIFDIKTLVDFSLHGNKLTTLPKEIGNLTNLMQLCISNNDISKLPYSIVNLKRIRSLQIENTLIKHIPAEFLENIYLDILSINDELLPEVAYKIASSNIDTINLIASNYDDFSQIVRTLNLYIDEDEWMETKDKTDKGCILLKKDSIRSAVRIAKKIVDGKM